MTDESNAHRVAEYVAFAERMQAAAERAFDPAIASQYLALAAKWLRLAEEAQRRVRYIDRTDPKGRAPGDHRN